jgi:hypothetical protein
MRLWRTVPGLLAACLLVRCDDVSPLAYTAPVRDAGPEQVDSVRVEACYRCTTADGAICRDFYDSCAANDQRCPVLFDCMTESDCWRRMDPNNLNYVPVCGARCLDRAGVVGLNDIAAAAASFFFCVIGPDQCAPVCIDSPGQSSSSERDAGGDASVAR